MYIIKSCTAIPYRVNTGPELGFPCKFFPNREKLVFITGIQANENRFFPVGKNLQGKPCFHYRDGFAVQSSVTDPEDPTVRISEVGKRSRSLRLEALVLKMFIF